MSEQAIINLAEELNLTVEQASAVWLKTRRAMFKTLASGHPVDLGFGYLSQVLRTGKRRHDFTIGDTVVVPDQVSLKMMVPPHIRRVLNGNAQLSPYIWMTRGQLKRVDTATKAELKRQGCDYYQLKGVTA